MRFKLSPLAFDLSQTIKGITEPGFQEYLSYISNFKTLMNFEGRNLRVTNVSVSGKNASLDCQPVYYPDYVRTNLCLDYRYGSDGRTLRHLIHPNGTVDSLAETPLGNNLGINCLLFTSGGRMIVQRRSRDVIVRPGELAPAFSGTVEPRDVAHGKIAEMICREGREELGERLFTDDIPIFLGMTRELVRGGQPEMFYFSVVHLEERDVKEIWRTARDKREVDRLEFCQIGDGDYSNLRKFPVLRSDISDFIKKNGRNISLPLKTNLALWYRWLEHHAKQN